jgi:hypothetical protein
LEVVEDSVVEDSVVEEDSVVVEVLWDNVCTYGCSVAMEVEEKAD